MSAATPLLLSIAVLAAFALAWGGVRQATRPAGRRQGLLMLGAAAVLLANVLIWTLPIS